MGKSKITDSQIIAIHKHAEIGGADPDLCRELTISTATVYKWRAQYGGMDTSIMTWMKGSKETREASPAQEVNG